MYIWHHLQIWKLNAEGGKKYFLQLSAKNLVKTLKHGSLHEKLLVLANSTRFDGFSQNAILFATFC